MTRCFLLLLFALLAPGLTAAPSDGTALLRQVANNWLDEHDRWAFTQQVREYDARGLKQERFELYDPSRGDASRWRLLSIDGHPPTPEQWRDWYNRKYRRHRRADRSLADNLDFDNAKVIAETPAFVRYELPLRNSVEWLFPINKVELIVTISREGPALQEVQARISEPFKVALGLARVLDIDLDVQMEPPPPQDPADAKPSGTAHAVVSKLGARVEYFWSDFKRVGPRSSAVAEPAPRSCPPGRGGRSPVEGSGQGAASAASPSLAERSCRGLFAEILPCLPLGLCRVKTIVDCHASRSRVHCQLG